MIDHFKRAFYIIFIFYICESIFYILRSERIDIAIGATRAGRICTTSDPSKLYRFRSCTFLGTMIQTRIIVVRTGVALCVRQQYRGAARGYIRCRV